MDLTQIIILSVIIVLTIFLVVLGLQVFFVLRDLRKTLFRMNRLFDDTDDLVSQVKKPIQSAGNFFTALATGAGIAHFLKRGSKESPSSAKASEGKKESSE